jgi:hypothetical protein
LNRSFDFLEVSLELTITHLHTAAINQIHLDEISEESSSPSPATKSIGETLFKDISDLNRTLNQGSSEPISPEKIKGLINGLGSKLESNPQTRPLLDQIRSKAAGLYEQCKNEKFDWKEAQKNGGCVVKGWDDQRKAAYEGVCAITALICDTMDVDCINIGSQGEASDADITISFKDSKNKTYADQASLGKFSAVAGIVWQSIFGGTSLQQADTEFYPPHTAHYFKEDSISSTENYEQLNDACRLSNILLHAQKTTPDDFETIKKALIPNRDQQTEIAADDITDRLNDQMENDNQLRSQLGSFDHLLNNFKTIELSKKMEAVSKQIDQAEDKESKNVLKAQFKFLAGSRGRFLPEAYISQAADVILFERKSQTQVSQTPKWHAWQATNQKVIESLINKVKLQASNVPITYQAALKMLNTAGWQLPVVTNHQKFIDILSTAIGRLANSKNNEPTINKDKLIGLLSDPYQSFDQSFKRSDSKNLVASVVENGSFGFHRLHLDPQNSLSKTDEQKLKKEAVVDASKYFTRVYQGFVSFLEQQDLSDPKATNMLKDCQNKLRDWKNLEAEKRGRFAPELIQTHLNKSFKKHLDQFGSRAFGIKINISNLVNRHLGVLKKDFKTSDLAATKAAFNAGKKFLGLTVNPKFNSEIKKVFQEHVGSFQARFNNKNNQYVADSMNRLVGVDLNIQTIKSTYLEDLSQITNLFSSNFEVLPDSINQIFTR